MERHPSLSANVSGVARTRPGMRCADTVDRSARAARGLDRIASRAAPGPRGAVSRSLRCARPELVAWVLPGRWALGQLGVVKRSALPWMVCAQVRAPPLRRVEKVRLAAER